jgi:hypothetical protein
MSEEPRTNKNEKDEKDRGGSWDEKWRRDPIDAAGWAVLFIWAGLALIAANLGYLDRFETRLDTWELIFAGAGVLVLVQVLIRLLVPAYRRPILGSVIFAVILLGIGLGDLVGWSLIGAVGLIVIGAAYLLRGLLRGGR